MAVNNGHTVTGNRHAERLIDEPSLIRRQAAQNLASFGGNLGFLAWDVWNDIVKDIHAWRGQLCECVEYTGP
jgi:hypothetical protein